MASGRGLIQMVPKFEDGSTKITEFIYWLNLYFEALNITENEIKIRYQLNFLGGARERMFRFIRDDPI
jgi:hypothetical protein